MGRFFCVFDVWNWSLGFCIWIGGVIIVFVLGVGDIDVGCELNKRIVFWYDWNIVVMYSLIML